ncbi:40S ribosomal protein S15-4 [Citrus sinensis]|nr:40S ribosomal protein S15-4 [Citrus sinensis]
MGSCGIPSQLENFSFLIGNETGWDGICQFHSRPAYADGDADVAVAAAAGLPKKRTFKKFSFRGVDLDALLDMSNDELVKLFSARARRRFQRGLKRKPMALIKKLRKAGVSLSIWSSGLCGVLVSVFGVLDMAEWLEGKDFSNSMLVLGDKRSDIEIIGLLNVYFQLAYFSSDKEFILNVLDQKREAPPGEKPEPVRTHLRNMIIVPEMIGSIIGVYNGKTFNQVEIKPEMIGHYLAEFSISYKPVKHGRPGIGATHSSRSTAMLTESYDDNKKYMVLEKK